MKSRTLSNLFTLLAAFMITATAFSQAIRDRNVIPVAVNLNEVMRMTITNGGNIEFTFNSIDDYRSGLSGDVGNLLNAQDADVGAASANPAATGGGTADANNMYKTDFTVASSVRWKIVYGSEEATFIGTDNPANTMNLNNVGFTLVNLGTHTFPATGIAPAGGGGQELHSPATDNATDLTALHVYPQDLIVDGQETNGNSGDATDNSFEMIWRCGTTEAPTTAGDFAEASMNALSILNQGDINPDRYVTNVVFELQRDF